MATAGPLTAEDRDAAPRAGGSGSTHALSWGFDRGAFLKQFGDEITALFDETFL